MDYARYLGLQNKPSTGVTREENIKRYKAVFLIKS